MNIQPQIKIGSLVYKIRFDDMTKYGSNTIGNIDYRSLEITLNTQQEWEKNCQILWHEILHGILENLGMDDMKEQDVQSLASAIHGVIVDNPDMFKGE